MNPDGPFDNRPVTQPAVWLPQNEIANSPSNPVQLTQGPFAGQLVYGDVTYGGLQRVHLEKVNGEYQGAVFRMTQGLESGVNRITLGPDGAIYTGGIHGGGNWGQEGKLAYGLQKLAPTGTGAFDILAMRAVEGGFELEYTQPLSATTAQNLAAKYNVKQWRYVPTAAYGGPKVDEQTLTATSATLSTDRKKVTLKISDLQPGRVVHIRSPRPFSAESGASLWSTEAWYTLNAMPGVVSRTGAVVSAASNKCLDISGSGTADGTKIQLWTCNGTGAQQWTIGGDGTFRALGKCLDVKSGGTVNGTLVQLWTCNGTGSQTWSAQANGSLVNPQSGRCLDVSGNGTADGTQIHIWDCHGGANQRWTLPA
jgi:hypothetical protein